MKITTRVKNLFLLTGLAIGTAAANCDSDLEVTLQNCKDSESGPFGSRDCDDLLPVDPNGDTSCIREVSMELCAKNVGELPMRLRSFTFEIEGRGRENIFSDSRTLTTGQAECVSKTVLVNACRSPVQAVVIARGSNRARYICTGTETFTFGAKPAIINQVCDINLKARCSTAADSRVDCSAIPRPTDKACSCTGQCAASYDFLYTGKTCTNQNENGFISCEDFDESKPSFVSIIVRDHLSPQVVLFDDLVSEDEVFTVVSAGRVGCFPEEIVVDVFSRGSTTRRLQTMEINTRCNSNGIRLGGATPNALEFIGYQCQRDSGEASCLADVNLRACVVNTRTDESVDLSAFVIKAEGEARISVIEDPIRVQGGGSYCSNQSFRVNVCQDDPLFILEAEGDQGDCTAFERFVISAATKAPTKAPTPRIQQTPTNLAPAPAPPLVLSQSRPSLPSETRYYGRPGVRQGKGTRYYDRPGVRQGKGTNRVLKGESDMDENESAYVPCPSPLQEAVA